MVLSGLASGAPYKTASHAKPTRAAKSLSIAIAGHGARDHQKGVGMRDPEIHDWGWINSLRVRGGRIKRKGAFAMGR